MSAVWSDPPDFMNGAVLTETQLDTLSADLRALTAWQSYTPTVIQSGTVTVTVTYAKYISAGKRVRVQVKLTVTGSGTTNNAITVSLPVTAITSGIIVGDGLVIDQSVDWYPALVQTQTTNTVSFLRTDASPASGAIGVNPNFGLANTDLIFFDIEYEAA